MALTRRQHEVLEFVREFIGRNGYSPSLEEIGSALGLSSVATVHKHVSHLVEKGYVRRVSNQNRSIEIVDPDESRSTVALPLRGILRGGRPVEAIRVEETVSVPRDMVNSRHAPFVLRVEGSHMADQQIRDGDYVIVEDRQEIEDGETVIAVVDGAEATLRRFHRDGSTARLEGGGSAARATRAPEHRLNVRGVVVGMIRRY